MRLSAGITAAGAVLSVAGAAHAALNARLLRVPSSAPPIVTECVSVCVPARNEERHIGPCVESIVSSSSVADIEVLVLDDGSTDRTAALATAAGARVITGQALPKDWLGKPNACHQLAGAARGSVLVFVDADVRLEPHAVAAGVDLLRTRRLDMVSPYPRQLALTVSERLVQPLLQWTWLTFLPLRWSERHGPESMVAANGQFLVVDAEAYRAAGGHAAVKAAVIEDVWLARTFKRSGGAVCVADGASLATCRMYESWREVRDGYTKSLWAAGSAPLAAMLTVAYLVPPLSAVFGGGRTRAVGAAGYAAAVAGRVISARRTGGRPVDGLAHPVSIAALLGLGVRSRWIKRRGRLMWKGRSVG